MSDKEISTVKEEKKNFIVTKLVILIRSLNALTMQQATIICCISCQLAVEKLWFFLKLQEGI